jgi:hypothetical protein
MQRSRDEFASKGSYLIVQKFKECEFLSWQLKELADSSNTLVLAVCFPESNGNAMIVAIKY